MRTWRVASFLFLLLAAWGCQTSNEAMPESEDVLLAEVFKRRLYLNDLRNMIHEDASPQDSIRIVNAYVNRWVRDQLLLVKAEENIPKDLNLDKLVQDYRASLILNNYERLLMETQLDSSISEQALLTFYEANKEQYILEKPIAHIYFVKLRQDSPNIQQALEWWSKNTPEQRRRLQQYAQRHAVMHLLEDENWLGLDEIMEMVPTSVINENSLRPGKEVRYQDGDYQYLLRVEEVRSRLEVAPISYIRDQATRAILLQRQIALLDSVKDRLYEIEIRKNNVKIHTH